MSLETKRIAPPRKTNGLKPLNGQPAGGRDLLDELLVKTSRTFALSIPVFEPTFPAGTVEVTVEGGFYGTDWPSGLATESVQITIPPR